MRSLIERYQLDSAQSERVRSVALSIYDAVKDEWKFGPPAGRAMLKWAAVLYEIGLCIEYKRAPQHAWYIINNIDMPGFTIPQKQLLSALLYNERDGFHLDVLEKQSAVPFSEACRLARILRISIIMCMRRSDGTLLTSRPEPPETRLTSGCRAAGSPSTTSAQPSCSMRLSCRPQWAGPRLSATISRAQCLPCKPRRRTFLRS